MSKQRIEIEVEIPEGYEATGEHRPPVIGDHFIGTDGKYAFCRTDYMTSERRIIIRRKEPTHVRLAKYIKVLVHSMSMTCPQPSGFADILASQVIKEYEESIKP